MKSPASLFRSAWVVCYAVLFFALLGPLLFLKGTFCLGDYWEQFFPWSYIYAESFKNGFWPFWIETVSNGFPLIAEGQVGAYYLLHQLFYSILPFIKAYTWMIPFHLLIGAVGFYLYGKRIGLSPEGAQFATVLFSFSSAYGGCFYTTGTLRVLSWFPWGLYLLDEILSDSSSKRIRQNFLLLSLLLSQMWTAGFPQLTVYALIFFVLQILLDGRQRVTLYFWFFATVIISIGLALPQILQTAELARQSIRSDQPASFALWGSMNPASPLSLLFPHWGALLRTSLYIGVIPFAFFLLALFLKKSAIEKKLLGTAIFFYLLAIGKFNPMYRWAVETFSLTAFRNPSKFIFFTAVCLALLAGFGYDKSRRSDRAVVLWRRIVGGLLAGVLVLPMAVHVVLKTYEGPIRRWGEGYAAAVFSSKAEPLKDLSHYVGVMSRFWDQLSLAADLRNPWLWQTTVFLICGWLLCGRRNEGSAGFQWRRGLLALTVALDLLLFSKIGTGFIGNTGPIPPSAPSAILLEAKALAQTKQCNLIEWVGPGGNELAPASSNLLYDIPHAGAYSPLLLRRYYELARDLGIADASLGRSPFKREIWTRQRKLLDLFGAGVVVSDEPLNFSGFRLIKTLEGRFLYENSQAVPPFFSVPEWKVLSDKKQRLEYLKSVEFDPRREAILESAPPTTDGQMLVVLRSNFYSRLRAAVGTREYPVFATNHAFCGVWVPKGSSQIRIFYDESSDHAWEKVSLVLWTIVLGFLCALWAGEIVVRKRTFKENRI